MVRLMKDPHTGDVVVQTNCLDTDSFMADLAECMSTMGPQEAEMMFSLLQNAMPIAYKLSGYKADQVQEQRTLVCGRVSPMSCDVVATAGK